MPQLPHMIFFGVTMTTIAVVPLRSSPAAASIIGKPLLDCVHPFSDGFQTWTMFKPYLDRFWTFIQHSQYERLWLNIPDMPSSPGCIVQVRPAVTMSELSARSLMDYIRCCRYLCRLVNLALPTGYDLEDKNWILSCDCQVITAPPSSMHIALSTISLSCRSILGW